MRFQEQLDALAAQSLERFGRVGVIGNNAGVSSLGAPNALLGPVKAWMERMLADLEAG